MITYLLIATPNIDVEHSYIIYPIYDHEPTGASSLLVAPLWAYGTPMLHPLFTKDRDCHLQSLQDLPALLEMVHYIVEDDTVTFTIIEMDDDEIETQCELADGFERMRQTLINMAKPIRY